MGQFRKVGNRIYDSKHHVFSDQYTENTRKRRHAMHLMFFLNEEGKRVYTLKVVSPFPPSPLLSPC